MPTRVIELIYVGDKRENTNTVMTSTQGSWLNFCDGQLDCANTKLDEFGCSQSMVSMKSGQLFFPGDVCDGMCRGRVITSMGKGECEDEAYCNGCIHMAFTSESGMTQPTKVHLKSTVMIKTPWLGFCPICLPNRFAELMYKRWNSVGRQDMYFH